MFITLKIHLSDWVVLHIDGDLEIKNKLDTDELVDKLSYFLHDKKMNGLLKGGFFVNVGGEDYRGAYSISGDYCDIVMLNKDIEFEDPGGDLVDKLTGLEGKYGLLLYLDAMIKEKKKFQLFLFDIDNFKNINDVFGNVYGDKILKEFVDRLLFNVVSNYTMFRYEGDTFALVREGRHEEKFVKMLHEALDDPFNVDGRNVYLTISIGSVNVEVEYGMTAETILDRAKIALNNAKSNGKNVWVIYNERLKDQSLMELEMEAMIRDALKKDEFELYYQPQFSLSKNTILVGAEALIRWNHPEKGFISPGVFIPVAEKTGLVVQIGDWVVKEVCRQQREWLDKGIKPVRISINIGALHFKKPTFVEDIIDCIERYNISTDLIGLEITEGIVINDVEDMVQKLNKLRSIWIKVSIDDFGTGYSSLSYLKKFPIDTLKIDKSFVLNIPKDQDNIAIVKAIIGIAKHMNLKVIAEGVETESARDLLIQLDCHDMQGYLFSKPVNSGEFEGLLIDEMKKFQIL